MKGFGLSGAAGTGKTTVARDISARTGLPMLSSPAQRVYRELGVDPKTIGHDPEMHRRIQWSVLIRHEDDLMQHQSGFVCDRSPLDMLAYFESIEGNTQADVRHYAKLVKHLLATHYQTVLIFPLGVIPYVDDEKRLPHSMSKDLDFRTRLEDRGFEFGVCPILRLTLSPDHETRVQDAMRQLGLADTRQHELFAGSIGNAA